MALEGENEDLTLGSDGASDAGPVSNATETVSSTVREAYEQAREVAEADGDPEKLEAIRVKRAKDGRFERKPREAAEPKETAPEAPEAQQKPTEGKAPVEEAQKAPESSPSNAPLQLKPPVSKSWTAQARADFAKLPRHIQEAIAGREVEANNGFAILADYKGMEEFMPVIKASGLTAAQFTKNAVEWERSLKTQPVTTIMHAAKMGGVDMVRLSQEILRQAGQRGQQPQGQAQPQPRPQQPPVNVQQAVQAEFTRMQREFAHNRATADAEAFLADPANVHAEAVLEDMIALIKQGRAKSYKDAYDMAVWANPDTRDLLIKQKLATPSNGNRRAVEQARAAAKATVGAPGRQSPPRPASIPTDSVRSTVRAVYQAALDAE